MRDNYNAGKAAFKRGRLAPFVFRAKHDKGDQLDILKAAFSALFHAPLFFPHAILVGMSDDEFRPYRRLLMAVVQQAVRDCKMDRDALLFLKEFAPAYLSVAGFSRPSKRVADYVNSHPGYAHPGR